MKKITCVGYHATGSGVIDDLFREFDNVAQGHYEAECRVLHDADGISDLEYHLVENPHRLKTEVAIERFLRYARESRRQYEKTFGKDWMPLCEEYIDSITKFRYKGWHSKCLKERSVRDRYTYILKKAQNKLRFKKFRHPVWFDYFPKEMCYHASLGEEEFLEKTQLFTEKLCNLIPQDEKTEFVLVDQMIPGDHPERYFRYVKDLKAIVVDRDPRDLYIHHIIHKDHILPVEPRQFCVHYKDIRKKRGNIDPANVLYVTFEDMIYNYDSMIKKVMDFVGITSGHHITPKSHFIPSTSISGTRLWEKYPEYMAAVKVIESELPKYLHKY